MPSPSDRRLRVVLKDFAGRAHTVSPPIGQRRGYGRIARTGASVHAPAMIVQSSEWCRECRKPTLHQRRECNHLLHGLVTVFVSALWLFFWVIFAGEKERWRCQACGYADPPIPRRVDVWRILTLLLVAIGAMAIQAVQVWVFGSLLDHQ